MAHIKDVEIGSSTYLIEPILYAPTSGTADAFTLTLDNFELVTGAQITAKITTTNNAIATLNVNNTGAKNIRYNGADITIHALTANRFYSFIYDGTYWQLIGELDTQTITGVKGNEELNYRTGNVNLTPANIGAYSTTEIDTRLKKYLSYAHYSNTNEDNSGKYYKININATNSWMLNFTIKLYHAYAAYDLQISGYQYDSNYWYSPKAIILGANTTDAITVLFGYDSVSHLWVAIPAGQYTGIDVLNATNGYSQIEDIENLFTITMVDSEPTTKQTTITAYRPWYRNEAVSFANAANIATTTNAIAYYTNTIGTFGTKASADGALYATSANGALQWGTLPVGQGGTGNTTGTATYATTTDDTSNTLYPVGVTSGATTTLKRDTSITMTSGTLTLNKIQLPTQDAAYTDGIQFMNSTTKKGSIGCDSNGVLGLYGVTKISLRPILDAATDGIEITTTSMIPTKNNAVTLGSTSNKWSNIYATTFTGDLIGDVTGNASTATIWQTARTLTIGATGKSVNGGANVSWSMDEIMGSSDSTKFYRGDKTWNNTLTGRLYLTTVAQGNNDYTGQLSIESASTVTDGNYFSSIAAIAPNVGNSQHLFLVGTARSAKNSAYYGFHYSGTSGSNDNYATIGLYGVDQVINLRANGCVGIGTTTPTYKLQVNGTSYFSDTITGDILSSWHILGDCPSNTTNFNTYFETATNLHHDNPARTDCEISYNRWFASNSDQTNYGPSALNLPVIDQHILSFGIDNGTSYSRHIAFDIRTNAVYVKARNNGTWTNWEQLVRNTGTWGINITGNATTSTKARYVEGDNDAANPGGALLRSGAGRADASPAGDTWIYYDTLGETSSPWGIRHDQAANTISFDGGGNVGAYITLNTGNSKFGTISCGAITSSSTITATAGSLWVQGGSAAGGNSNRMTLTSGMPTGLQYNTNQRGTRIFANAIALADPYNGNSNSDAGWIRHIEETANSGTLEIAVGDDGDESIVARQYNTSSAIARTLTLLDASGNTFIPGTLYWAPNASYYWRGDYAYSGTYYTNNWFRSYNNTGWYNESYGGGIFMEDSTWVKVYNGKSFSIPGNLQVSTSNTTGGGIFLADDGSIVDNNNGYCSMRFTYGTAITSGNNADTQRILLRNTGLIEIQAAEGNWAEGLRIYPNGGWSTILLAGTDLGLGSRGTSANSWSIHNNNGDFFITRNGSNNGVVSFQCVNNHWQFCNLSNSDYNYAGAAMWIREYAYSGAGSGTWGQAPRLGWHWAGRVAAQIGLASDGWLYEAPATGTNFYRIVCETGTWSINITGTATYATNATYATYDTDGNNISSTYVRNYYQYSQTINSPALSIGDDTKYQIVLTAHRSEAANGYADISVYYNRGGATFMNWTYGSGVKIYGTLQNGSSLKIKKDINLISLSENIIDKLIPVSFKYKEHTDNKTHFGLIYEDTINLIPEICNENQNGYKTINYVELVPVLLKEIQNLRARVKTLEQK